MRRLIKAFWSDRCAASRLSLVIMLSSFHGLMHRDHLLLSIIALILACVLLAEHDFKRGKQIEEAKTKIVHHHNVNLRLWDK